jgi:hypothetical protein
MNQEWLDDAAKGIGVPAALSFFAYAYVVGFFLASDLAWFSFFTLSEHVVFAFRAIPIAVGASVVLVALYPRWRDRSWFRWIWTSVLFSVGVLSFLSNHFVMAIIVFLVAIVEVERRRDNTFLEKNTMLYWFYVILNLMILSIVAGFVSAMTWVSDFMLHLPLTPWMIVELKDPIIDNQKIISGRVMFAGESRILFYEPGVGTHLLRSEDIQHIDECRHYRLMDDHRACMRQ